MSDFFDGLAKRKSKVESLREAQEMRSTTRTVHPAPPTTTDVEPPGEDH
jgi:hypothetical protein